MKDSINALKSKLNESEKKLNESENTIGLLNSGLKKLERAEKVLRTENDVLKKALEDKRIRGGGQVSFRETVVEDEYFKIDSSEKLDDVFQSIFKKLEERKKRINRFISIKDHNTPPIKNDF